MANDQSRYRYLLSRLRDNRQDINAQHEVLGVLVKTIESEYHLMENLVKEEAVNVILEVQQNIKDVEGTCPELEGNCRMGLGKLN